MNDPDVPRSEDSTWPDPKRCKQLFEYVSPITEAWQKIRVSEDETATVAAFIRKLGDPALRMFALTEADLDYLTGTDRSDWRTFCLSLLRGKIAVHVGAAVEALEVYEEYGYLQDASSDTGEPGILLDVLRSIRIWMGLYTQNNQRQLEEAVCQGRFGCSGEESPIDTELFTACLLVSTSSSENDGVRQAAERIIARSIEENLFGVSLSSIRDEANLWWGIRLAVRQLSKDKATILSMLPGKEADPVGKAVSIIGLATLRSFKAFKEEEHLHPLDYTPEIYKDDLRSFCFGLQNVLDIQLALSENSIFRRTPHYWSAMDRLDDVVDVCAGALGEKADELNLYLLSHLNRSMVLWLAHARTRKRWETLGEVSGLKPSADSPRIECVDIVAQLNGKPLEGFVCNNSQFCGQIKAVLQKMQDYIKSASFRHPFTVAICGPPGSGKTHLAKSLLKSLGVAKDIDIGAFNLASNFPGQSECWTTVLKNDVVGGEYAKGGNHHFQAVIIDEADSTNPHNWGREEFAYQWLLQPLWESWPNIAWTTDGPRKIPTFVFVIGSRYRTWFSWCHYALKPHVSKGRDFVSRIDEKMDLPLMSPEDQLLMAASFLRSASIEAMDAEVAELISCGRFEHQARSVEAFIKQCRLNEAKAGDSVLLKDHVPKSGTYEPKSLLLTRDWPR